MHAMQEKFVQCVWQIAVNVSFGLQVVLYTVAKEKEPSSALFIIHLAIYINFVIYIK